MDNTDKDKLIQEILKNTAKSAETSNKDSVTPTSETKNSKGSDNEYNTEAFNTSDGEMDKNSLRMNSDGLLPESKMPPKKHAKNSKSKKKKRVFLLVLAIVIITIAVSVSQVIISVGKDFLGVRTPNTDNTLDDPESYIEINIPTGATGQSISQLMDENNIVKYPLIFRLYLKMQNPNNITAGKHKLNNQMSYDMILDELKSPAINDQVEVSVTFPEGFNLVECAQLLEQTGICNADEFIKGFNNYRYGFNFEDKIEDNSMKLFKMEGYLFPDTYVFYKDSDIDAVCYKIFANFAEKVNRNDIGRMTELGLSLEQTITLASVVQAEAGIEREMKNVASVFLNRLKNSEEYPKLQSDPTTKYSREVVTPNLGDKSEELISAYDTYASEGLPPGAICNPGYEAIKAVLYSSDTDYYYFCSNLDTKEFFYAKTNAEHEKNLVTAGLK